MGKYGFVSIYDSKVPDEVFKRALKNAHKLDRIGNKKIEELVTNILASLLLGKRPTKVAEATVDEISMAVSAICGLIEAEDFLHIGRLCGRGYGSKAMIRSLKSIYIDIIQEADILAEKPGDEVKKNFRQSILSAMALSIKLVKAYAGYLAD